MYVGVLKIIIVDRTVGSSDRSITIRAATVECAQTALVAIATGRIPGVRVGRPPSVRVFDLMAAEAGGWQHGVPWSRPQGRGWVSIPGCG